MIMVPDKQIRVRAFVELVEVTGRLARFCDYVEHNEGTNRTELLDVGSLLRRSAVSIIRANSLSLRERYADRLEELESRNVLRWDGAGNWPEIIRNAKTWRDIQVAQARHDATYHPDVIGLPRSEQVRHYTLHLSKLVWKMLPGCEDDSAWREFAESRLIDLIVFGVKLATVANVSLSDLASDEPS